MVNWVDKVEGHLLGNRPLAPSQVVQVTLGKGKLLGEVQFLISVPSIRRYIGAIIENLGRSKHCNGHGT